MEHGVYKAFIAVVLALVVIQRAVEIGRAVVKGREEEAKLRVCYHPVRAVAVEGLLGSVIAQCGLGLLHRADGAHKIGKLAVRKLVKPPVLAPERDVIHVAAQQHQQIALTELEVLRDGLIELVAGLFVCELAGSELAEQAVLVAVRHLGGGEHDVRKRPAHGAGDAFFQQLQIFFLLLHRQKAHGFVKGGDDLAKGVDVAAVDPADIGSVGAKSSAKLRHFLVDHLGYLHGRLGMYQTCVIPNRRATLTV